MIDDFRITGRPLRWPVVDVRADDGMVLASYRHGMNGWKVQIGCDHDVYVASDADARAWLEVVREVRRVHA